MLKDRRLESRGTHDISNHEGIRTVGIEKICEFSTGSVVCVCVVTWNMNGKVSIYEGYYVSRTRTGPCSFETDD